MAETPKVFNGKQKFTQKKPFTNLSGLQIGQKVIWKDQEWIVSAIVRLTDTSFGIYGYKNDSGGFNYGKCKDEQERRERGQISVFLSGYKIMDRKSCLK